MGELARIGPVDLESRQGLRIFKIGNDLIP